MSKNTEKPVVEIVTSNKNAMKKRLEIYSNEKYFLNLQLLIPN